MRTQGLTHRAAHLLFIGLLGLLSIGCMACDSGGDSGDEDPEEEREGFPEPPGRPGFTSSVIGGMPLSLSGTAHHGLGLTGDPAASGFTVRLAGHTDRASPVAIVLMAERPTAPGPGVYAIGDPAEGADFAAKVTLPDRPAPFRAAAGTLEVVERPGDTLAARFRFETVRVAGGPFSVSGAFRSVPP